MSLRRNRLIFLTALLIGCAEESPPPAFTVGGLAVAESAVANLSEPERQILVDLVAFGAAVATQSVDSLVEPIVRREVEASSIAALPLHLAARDLGLSGERLASEYIADPEWELDVRHVVRLVDPGDPAAVADSASRVVAEVAERAAAGEDFASLAAEYSEEPGAAERGGLLRPGRRGSWVEPFWNAASELRPDQVTGVVRTEYGYHVIRLDDRRPVPFEEADRTGLLRRIVSPDAAAAAMQQWAGTSGPVLVEPPALQQARNALAAGDALPDTLVIAHGTAGGRYTGDRLAAGWARLAPEDREQLSSGDLGAFVAWAEADARDAIWASVARQMGADPEPAAVAAARLDWQSRALGWGSALGFGPGMSDEQIVGAAGQALLSGAPAARAARAEIRALRPLLRDLYPTVAFGP